jgi:hypothetical protein
MDWIAAAVEWRNFKYEVHAQWQKLTAAQLEAIAGVRSRLGRQICATYGVTAEEAERQMSSFEARNEYFSAISTR